MTKYLRDAQDFLRYARKWEDVACAVWKLTEHIIGAPAPVTGGTAGAICVCGHNEGSHLAHGSRPCCAFAGLPCSCFEYRTTKQPLAAPRARPSTDARRAEFFAALDAKLEQGARTYGEASFERPAPELLDELEAEALDIAGWGFILWTRIRRLRNMAGDAERRAERSKPPRGIGPAPCLRPIDGTCCIRDAGHDGPCKAPRLR